MTAPGWYDDPWNPAQQRYWDGATWTPQERPRQGPPAYLGQAGAAGYGSDPAVAATPDGVPLAGWWTRAVAKLLDWLIVFVVSLPLSGYFWYRFFVEPDPGTPLFSLVEPWAEYRWVLATSLIQLLVGVVYEYLFLVRTGATPGKMAVGISVRLRDVAGPPPGPAVLKRIGLTSAFSLAGTAPGVVGILGIGSLVDVLWPLRDGKKQALHDKVAATNVVRGKQPQPAAWSANPA
ncbi:RDD family protein [Kribbella flavida]|nr:RDD family protein [Kribbella flavida]